MDIEKFLEFVLILLIALSNFIPLGVFIISWYKLDFSNWLCYLIIVICIINIGIFFMMAGNIKINKGDK